MNQARPISVFPLEDGSLFRNSTEKEVKLRVNVQRKHTLGGLSPQPASHSVLVYGKPRPVNVEAWRLHQQFSVGEIAL